MNISQANLSIDSQASPLLVTKALNNSVSGAKTILPNTNCVIKSQIPLATLTSFRVGGPAEWYVAPRNLAELQASLLWANTEGLAVTLLGAGSNLLVSDRGIPGLVISTRHLRHTEFNFITGEVTVAAGEPLPRLAWQAAERGWQGLEWAVGIPGSVGGAVVMNAGAHRSCIADILVSAQVLSVDGEVETLTPEQLDYRYRTSVLQGHIAASLGKPLRFVTQATFRLQPGADPEQVLATTSQHLEQRRATQPYHLPSCGSVFRNPRPYTAGWLIEQTGLKGYKVGGAQIAERHANFILNCGGAKASDILQIINYVQDQVQQHWSILLEPEVKILGEFE
ncbi:UDP-N-acetylmuramate dehydrogenase [Gloeocapsopsis crepidinum LEGE 06123]|uniref:UDP-N-acetylenolpyruvoylglucosamine reductase n=1 Tax=Gloeocapsopsis crepidinum LEGE 06123 TaxID=588587 RepID=A0ABR9UVM6_9CHRO|nr:UDP-N-acetylmuramate dehydrogenase [Gloeocapsopsis crepidinum]MBE9191635.1 UDP-N-acetylmuramate dehydrogenase [Gloeocapsopsis crepidinum LEGE 06123]